MDLNLVQTFARVAEAQSFTGAARALGLPKSSVSRAVSRLEEELGVRLLERTTRRLNLTDEGRTYYESALRGLTELSEGERRVAELQGDPRGLVRLTAPVDLDEGPLVDLVLDFQKKYPRIHLEVSFSNRLVDLAQEGFDIAIRAGRMQDSSLIARKIGSSDAWLFASPAYLKRRGRPRTPADLAGHDCVLFNPRHERATWPLTGPKGLEPVEVSGIFHTDNLAFVRQLVLGGAGIGLIPSTMGQADLREKRLQRVLPDHDVRGAAVYVVVPSMQHLPRRVSLFRQYLIDSFPVACTSHL
jgi:DNA-binding transcriptional LysR family regulator